MLKTNVYDMTGKVVEEIELDANIFGIEINEPVMHMAVVNQLANKRQGTHSTLVKSEVSGGGKKPWRQKGTGRARQGSTRSAQWIHGGIIFGPKPRDYSYKLPKKVRRLALKSALSVKAADSSIVIIDKLELPEIKTQKMVAILKNIGIDTSALLVTADTDSVIIKSAQNIEGIKSASVNCINVYDILRFNKFIITKDALSKVSEVYA